MGFAQLAATPIDLSIDEFSRRAWSF